MVLVGWVDARRRGDLETIEGHIHPDAIWHGLRPDLVCRNRDEILANIRNGAGRLPDIEGIELHADGDQVLFGVRSPDLVEVAGEQLDGAVYQVLTIAGRLIVRMDEYRTRDEALEAMRLRREAVAAAPEPPQRTPTAPVDDLIAFVHVADVSRSIAFYELLGFSVSATYSAGDELDWASLSSADAKLMVARADESIGANDQGVSFYLYTTDLPALQQHLRAHGERVGAIRDGSPGPRAEMCMRDPDGYGLTIAQREG